MCMAQCLARMDPGKAGTARPGKPNGSDLPN